MHVRFLLTINLASKKLNLQLRNHFPHAENDYDMGDVSFLQVVSLP